jgi:flagellar assembly factor FliW
MNIQTQHSTAVADERAIVASQITQESYEPAPVSEFVETRFGRVRVLRDQPIIFRKGILGMPEKTSFSLVEFPIKKFEKFKLLQSLEDDNLSFITLPLPLDNDIISRTDLEEGCKDLGFTPEQIAVLLIVSVHREMTGVRLSVNARAPLFLDASRRVADQCVLRNNNYEVRHMLRPDNA